jgi:hypothetical protein
LSASFGPDHSAASLNAVVVPLLLQAGVELLEIQRGSDLETEYLRLAGP